MDITKTAIEGVFIIEPKIFRDARGYFFESFSQREFDEKIGPVELTEDNHRQFFIPKGFAHGFAVLSPEAVFQYKCDEFYHPEAEGGISIQDESLGIDWHIPADRALLSEKDLHHPRLEDFDTPFV